MVSTPRMSTDSSAGSGPSGSGAPPRARNQTRRNTQRLDEALGGLDGGAGAIVPPDVATLPDRERVFATPRSGDWILLAIMLVTLLGCGGYVWYRLGLNDHIGRAVFFGLALVCLYWTALIYTFKLSLSVHVGPQGISVVRGPWRMEMRWGDVSRLMERAQLLDGRRYRWVVAQGRDDRRIQVREDMVTDYARFRLEVYERYRLWRDHGGAWGTTSGGPFTASESVGDEIRWWLIGASVTALPGLYFWLLLPETNPLGLALVAIAALCVVMAIRAILLRQVYLVDSQKILARYLIGKSQLGWRDISRVERSRNPASWLIRAVAAMCRVAMAVAARSEVGLRSFPWSPRVPEYLTLRGMGRHVRVRLHRLARPDELLAWIEFYERVGRRPGGAHTRPRQTPPTVPLGDGRVAAATIPLEDLSDESGPRDPWAAAAAIGADPIDLPTVPTATVGADATHSAYDEYAYDDEAYDEGDENAEDEEDEESGEPVMAQTPEELEDAWLISTNKRPTVLAPNAQPFTPAEPSVSAGGAPRGEWSAPAQPYAAAQPGWGDAFAAPASEQGDYAERDLAARAGVDPNQAAFTPSVDATNSPNKRNTPYEQRERLRQERIARERAYQDAIAHGAPMPTNPASMADAPGVGGDGGMGAQPGRPARPNQPYTQEHGPYPRDARQPNTPAEPPVWTFPEPPARDNVPPAARPAEPAASTPASAFSAMSRDELLAEFNALGFVAPPPSSGVVPPPPAPRTAQAPSERPPSSHPAGERKAPPASEIADAPTAELSAVPPDQLYPAASNEAPVETEPYDTDAPDQFEEQPEPERPWLQEGWQPPALPRFGPGAHSPFHNPDDAD